MGTVISGICARLSRTKKIRNTATAQGRMIMIHTDILPVMPAPFAFGARARRYADCHVLAIARVYYARFRYDEYQPKVVSQGIKKTKIITSSVYLDLGCKGGSDFSSGAYLFQFSLYIRAQLSKPTPAMH